MKTVAAGLMMLVFFASSAVADDPSPSPVSTESLISSMPTQFEREWWKSYSEERRKSPAEATLAQKMKNISANCRQLQSRIIEGKPLSDYPGLLTLGAIIWDKSTKTYRLKVQAPMQRGEGDYGGFMCTFDQSFNIISVSTATYVC